MIISKQKTALFFSLSISITVFGALFNFIPWPLTLLGALGMVVFLCIQLFQKEQKTALDYVRLLLIISFTSNYSLILLGTSNEPIFSLATKITLAAFLLLYIKKIVTLLQDIMQNNTLIISETGKENLSYILADLATVYIVIASLFKMFNWELGIISSNLLLGIGLFTALISLLTSSKALAK